MAHAGRPASRHGTHDAFRKKYVLESAADELPSQSVFSYEGTEDVRQVRENPTVHRQVPTRSRTMSHGVIPSGPVVAVHMFDKSDSGDNISPTSSKGLRRWSREALDGSNNSFPPAFPQPPSTPRSSQVSMRRRSLSGQRPPSGMSQRPSSKKSARDYSLDQEDADALPPMTTLRPQSSLGKYMVLPSISPTKDRDKPTVDIMGTSRSDGSEDQRGMEEMEYLTSRMAHQTLVETSRSSRESLPDRPGSRDSATSDSRHPSGRSRSIPDSEPVAVIPTERHQLQRHCDSSASSTTSPELVNDRSHTSLLQYKMDEGPKPSIEGQILLGVKIPTDGTRHKHYFNPRDQLRCIVLFAEEVSGEDFSNHVLVLASPRQCFSNLSQTIEAAGLEAKSVLHLKELD